MREEVKVLLQSPEIQQRIISVLETMGLVVVGSKSFSTLEIIKQPNDALISKEDVNKFRLIFPPGKRGDLELIRKKMSRFMNENPNVELSKILQAAIMWVQTKGDYCGDAKYFFYKKTADGEESRCKEYLEYAVKKIDEDVI